jgi:hypothetical protein
MPYKYMVLWKGLNVKRSSLLQQLHTISHCLLIFYLCSSVSVFPCDHVQWEILRGINSHIHIKIHKLCIFFFVNRDNKRKFEAGARYLQWIIIQFYRIFFWLLSLLNVCLISTVFTYHLWAIIVRGSVHLEFKWCIT